MGVKFYADEASEVFSFSLSQFFCLLRIGAYIQLEGQIQFKVANLLKHWSMPKIFCKQLYIILALANSGN